MQSNQLSSVHARCVCANYVGIEGTRAPITSAGGSSSRESSSCEFDGGSEGGGQGPLSEQKEDEEQGQRYCAICMDACEAADSFWVSGCLHQFHVRCIAQLAAQNATEFRCPSCRGEILNWYGDVASQQQHFEQQFESTPPESESDSSNATGNDTSGDADWTLGSDDESSGGLRRTWHSRT